MTRIRPALVAHDVLRLQIAVNDACAVRGFQRAAGLLHDLDRFLRSKLALLLLHQAAQVLTLDVLHGDELHAIGFAQVVDPDDVLVGDLGGQKQFLLEAVNDGLVAGQVGPDDFQRHHAIQFAVARFVDRAHPAFAEDLQDFVALAENRARLQHGRIALGPWYPRRRGLAGAGAAIDHGRSVGAQRVHHGRRIRGIAPGNVHHGWRIRGGDACTLARNIDQGRRVRGRSSAGG